MSLLAEQRDNGDSPVVAERSSLARTVLGLAAFAVVAALVGAYLARHVGEVGQVDDYHWGLADFRDAVYYPCRAVRDGVNPYDPDAYREHFAGRVQGTFKLYSPLTFVLYLPLAYLPFHVAGWLYEGLNLALLVGCAGLVVRWCANGRVGSAHLNSEGAAHQLDPIKKCAVGKAHPTVAAVFGLAALVLASQPGQANAYYGQVTWPLVLGSYLALHFSRNRPALAGLALALASFKPTYAAVIGFLMLWRGDFRAVAYGVAFSVLGAMAGLGLMAAYGIDWLGIPAVLEANQRELFAASSVDPLVTDVRVDLPVLLVKALGASSHGWLIWLLPILVIFATGALVWRETRQSENCHAASFATFLLCLGAMVGAYRLVYDMLLVTLPVAALYFADHPSWKRLPRWGLVTLRILSALLALNYCLTGPGIRLGWLLRQVIPEALLPTPDAAWHVTTTINPLLLATMWILAVALVFTQSSRRVHVMHQESPHGSHGA